jgi:hypothetical protein
MIRENEFLAGWICCNCGNLDVIEEFGAKSLRKMIGEFLKWNPNGDCQINCDEKGCLPSGCPFLLPMVCPNIQCDKLYLSTCRECGGIFTMVIATGEPGHNWNSNHDRE